MESDQHYQYTALPPGGRATLQCSLYTSLISEAPDHETISYVWGLPTRDQTILCHDRVLMITQSLTDVLNRLRLPSEPHFLWADSICINQENNTEKGHQVGLMAKIYQQAKRTLIYLGGDSEGHAKAVFEMIEEANQRIEENCEKVNGPWAVFPPLDPDDPIKTDTRWNSVAALYSSAWFSRGWVV
ncbi:heterokaryon incompatibility protein-domain-containing protein [Xylariaceae sp. FL1651]|nr:heterokaryon incompatibility protein-domain-containing protein [Xylariaceae sp. FL1651]